MKVGFYVQRIDVNVASILYRGLYPAAQLCRAGHKAFVFDFPPSSRMMRALDALVIVKGMNHRAYGATLRARALGVPVVLDICDDIFVPGYGKGDGAEALNFRAMSAVASAIVTTGPAMVAVLRREIGPNANILVVEDPIETAADNRLVAAAIPQWRRETIFDRFVSAFTTKILATYAAIVRRQRRIKSRLLRLIRRSLYFVAVATYAPRRALAAMLKVGEGGKNAARTNVDGQTPPESRD